MNSIEFKSILFRISADQDGESKITLAVPLTELDKIMSLGRFTKKLLNVSITVDENSENDVS